MTRFPKKKNPGSSLWFHPNTLRRLSAKLAVRYWAHPRRFFSHLAALGLFNFLRLLRQREFAWLEDWFGVTFSGGVRNSPHPYVSLPVKARIALVVKVTPPTRPLLDRTLKSLQAQTRDAWHAFILDDLERSGGGFPEWNHRFQPRGIAASPVLDVLTEEKWDYLGFLEAGDILAPSALEQMLAPTRESEAPDLIYSDDEIPGRHPYQRRFHKPDWSPELLVSFNYIGDFFLVHPKHLKPWSVKRAWVPFDLYQILLGVLDKNIRVRHVPEVLFFHAVRRPAAVLTKSEIPKSNLRHNLAKVKRGSSFGENKADHPAVKGKPKVSILLLTALRKPVLLHRCLRSLMERTTYANYEIILVDNRPQKSTLPEEFLIPGLTRLVYPGPFNYARMNNIAARKAKGEYLLFLNDDTEVVSPDWIESLLACAQIPGAGVVGAKLLYPQGDVQHGGIFLVNQGAWARHAFRHLRHPENSYQGLLGVIRNCSAVTFACALVSRRLFEELGGLDEKLKVECNDVDFCLRALARGKRNIWTPFAVLVHHELVTRVKTHHPGDMAYFKKRWKKLLEQGDPYYNVNLSQDSDMYLPAGRLEP